MSPTDALTKAWRSYSKKMGGFLSREEFQEFKRGWDLKDPQSEDASPEMVRSRLALVAGYMMRDLEDQRCEK